MCFNLINADLGLEQWCLENWNSIEGFPSASGVSFLSWAGPTVMIDMIVNFDKKLLCVLGFLPLFLKMKKNPLSLCFLKSFGWWSEGLFLLYGIVGKEVGLVSVQLHPSFYPFCFVIVQLENK